MLLASFLLGFRYKTYVCWGNGNKGCVNWPQKDVMELWLLGEMQTDVTQIAQK